MDLCPSQIEDNTDCILCGGCLKVCGKHNPGKVAGRPNPGLVRIGFAGDLFKLKPLTVPQFFFLFVVSGFVVYEILSEWGPAKKILMFAPNGIAGYFHIHPGVLLGLVESAVLFLAFPLMLWLLPFAVSRLAGLSLSLKQYVTHYGIAFIPMAAAAHLSKAFLKMTSRIPYFQYVFSDPTGMKTTRLLLDRRILLHPNPLWLDRAITVLISAALIAGAVLSFKTVTIANKAIFRTDKRAGIFYSIPLIYGGIFVTAVIFWRWAGF